MRSILSDKAYEEWVARTRADDPDPSLAAPLPDPDAEQIKPALAAVGLLPHERSAAPAASLKSADLEDLPSFGAPHLNPRFTFQSFVIGPSNHFAHAAARSVATNPSRRYNPLCIYGGVGMGKTHLMHAIGRELMDRFGSMRVICTSSERFMNEMITCIRHDCMGKFHQRYRQADALLIDDIQLFGNKERTQEELFHTFNELYDHGRQIVITSDVKPNEVPGLMERLRSRFEWGLLVDIQPPDLDTKLAILASKAVAEGIQLPDEVIVFIASRPRSNVRELEGALVKLLAYSSVTGTPITLPMARQVLHSLAAQQQSRLTPDSVLRAVADRFHLQSAQLKEKTNTRNISHPRQIAMYLLKELTSASLSEIGKVFGGKHHVTVSQAIQKIDRLRQQDADLNALINSLTDSLQ